MRLPVPIPSLAGIVSAAMRQLGLECAGPGETGAQAIARLTGAAPGTVSRWLSYDRPEDLPSLPAVAVLEIACGRPVVTATLAGLTDHAVIPAIMPPHGSASPTAGVLAFCAAAGVTIADVTDSLADGRVTPEEARGDLAALHDLSSRIRALSQCLAAIAEGVPHDPL